LVWIMLRLLIITFRIRDPSLRFIIGAWASSFIGLCVASYTNGLLVQLPTGPMVYLGLAFVYMAPQWDKELEDEASERSMELT